MYVNVYMQEAAENDELEGDDDQKDVDKNDDGVEDEDQKGDRDHEVYSVCFF